MCWWQPTELYADYFEEINVLDNPELFKSLKTIEEVEVRDINLTKKLKLIIFNPSMRLKIWSTTK